MSCAVPSGWARRDIFSGRVFWPFLLILLASCWARAEDDALWQRLPRAPLCFLEWSVGPDRHEAIQRLAESLVSIHPALGMLAQEQQGGGPAFSIEDLAVRLTLRESGAHHRRLAYALVPSESFWNPLPISVLLIMSDDEDADALLRSVDAVANPLPMHPPELLEPLTHASMPRTSFAYQSLTHAGKSLLCVGMLPDAARVVSDTTRLPVEAQKAIGAAVPDTAADMILYVNGERLQGLMLPQMMLWNAASGEVPVWKAGGVGLSVHYGAETSSFFSRMLFSEDCHVARMLSGAHLSVGMDATSRPCITLSLLPDVVQVEAEAILQTVSPHVLTMLSKDTLDFAQMTGIHFGRDFFENWDGTAHAVLTGMPDATCVAGVRDERKMAHTLQRSADWFHSLGTFFSPAATLLSLSTDLSAEFSEVFQLRLKTDEGGSSAGKQYFILARKQLCWGGVMSLPASQQSMSSILSITAAADSVQIKGTIPDALTMAHLIDSVVSYASAAQSFLPDMSPEPIAVTVLDAIADAEFAYAYLELAEVNHREGKRFLPEFWRLGGEELTPGMVWNPYDPANRREHDAHGAPLSLLPELVSLCVYPYGYPVAGVLCAPAQTIGGRRIDWTKEFAFFALDTSGEYSERGVYFMREDGMIWRKGGASVMPEDVPLNPEQDGWERARIMPVVTGK